jgi:hypothetical protein
MPAMGNLGPAMPTILVVTCIGGLAYYAVWRRRRRNPPDGHDK